MVAYIKHTTLPALVFILFTVGAACNSTAEPRVDMNATLEAKAGEEVAEVKNCSAPVAEHYQLGQSFGISGTPAIILEDGSIIPGYQPAAALAQALDGKKS